jgi:hypothetical protein
MVEAVKPRKVAVGATVGFAYRSVFGRLELIPEFGWIMLLALLAVSIVPDILLPRRHAVENLDARDYVQAAVALLALSAFAVRWYQSILLGDPRRQPSALFFRGWVRFLVYGSLLYAVLGAIVASAALTLARPADGTAAQALVGLAAVVAGMAIALATTRCALVFPAAACGRPLGLASAWRLMRGNTWRLIWVGLLTTLPLKILTLGMTAFVIAVAAPDGSDLLAAPPMGFAILTGVIEAVADMLLAALGASVLSSFYRELVAWSAVGATGKS